MRRTLFVLRRELFGVVQAAASDAGRRAGAATARQGGREGRARPRRCGLAARGVAGHAGGARQDGRGDLDRGAVRGGAAPRRDDGLRARQVLRRQHLGRAEGAHVPVGGGDGAAGRQPRRVELVAPHLGHDAVMARGAAGRATRAGGSCRAGAPLAARLRPGHARSTSSGGWARRLRPSGPRSTTSAPWRSTSTVAPVSHCPTTSSPSVRSSRTPCCCRVWTRPPWAGSSASGTSARTRPPSSTATATVA